MDRERREYYNRGNFNEDIRKTFITDWREDLYLRDVMIYKVGCENTPCIY